jgi:tight adherence protein B
MIAIISALMAAGGAALLVGPRFRGTNEPVATPPWRTPTGEKVRQLLDQRSTQQLLVSTCCSFALGAALCVTIFGSMLPAIAGGGFAATFPITAARQRRQQQLAAAQESWPRMIDELRVLTAAAGRSIPQALLEVGTTAPVELRPAFAEASREWMLNTDLERMLAVLRAALADPTCDSVCETLLIAAELGGTDLDRRLIALAEDRRIDTRHRREARARQAGVRFARRFVLLVPLGMAAAGLAVGTGRSAYQTPIGQWAVLVAIAVTAGCWVWAGHMLRLPVEERVFRS